MFKIHYNYF